MEKTDIGDDIPISYLRPPFKSFYIEFTKNKTSNLKVFNEKSGEHILEGLYISESEILPDGKFSIQLPEHEMIDVSKPFRVLDLMFTGSPAGKSHNLDDALRTQSFYIQDNNLTIVDELKNVERRYGNDEDFVQDLDYLSKLLNHMAKALLFINCKQYRDTALNDRKEIEKLIKSTKSPQKLKKYEKKLRYAYDTIVISPEDNVTYKKSEDIDHPSNVKEKRAHWRKGHFKMQPYGPGSAKRKIIFVEPTIVGGAFARKKKYEARTKSKV